MADAVAIARLDDFIGEQMQAPALAPGGWCAADGGDEEGFGVAVEFAGFAMDLLFVKHDCLEFAQGEASSGLIDGKRANADLSGDGLIRAGSLLLIGVGEEQDLGAVAFSLGALVGAGDDFELMALFFRQGNVVLFGGHERLLTRDNAKRIPDFTTLRYYLDEVLVRVRPALAETLRAKYNCLDRSWVRSPLLVSATERTHHGLSVFPELGRKEFTETMIH